IPCPRCRFASISVTFPHHPSCSDEPNSGGRDAGTTRAPISGEPQTLRRILHCASLSSRSFRPFAAPIASTSPASRRQRRYVAPGTQFLLSHRLRWATLLAWGGLWLFLTSSTAISLTGQMVLPLPWLVSLANRFLIVTCCIWFIAAAWRGTRAPGP